MTALHDRTARSAALSGFVLAFGLFASAGLAAAGTPSGWSTAPVAATASTQCEMAPERCDVNREAREMGFGRRGGDK